VDVHRLSSAAHVLRHRGPDGTHTWTDTAQRTGMAFNRLALVGPASERQPFVDERAEVGTVVNGEVYGYGSIRAALEAEGARFKTASDCEVILHSYLREGSAFVRRLNGEFAFVIWDARTQTLIAARDRWGVKPLFYRIDARETVLASEAKAILSLTPRASWDVQSVFQQALAAMAPGRTLFEGIRQLEPGHLLIIRDGQARLSRYWDIDYHSSSAPLHTESLVEELRFALREAVKERLQGDYPVAAYLSAGVDSCGIAALAAQYAPTRVDTFTVDFAGADSEAQEARRCASQIGVHNHVLTVHQSDFADHFEDAVWHAETIGFNAVGVAKWLLSRFVRDHGYKAVLAGEGADELFAGYDFSLMDALDSSAPSQLVFARKLIYEADRVLSDRLGLPLHTYPMAAEHLPGRQEPFLLTSWRCGRGVFRHLLSEDLRERFVRDNPYEQFLEQIGADTLTGLSSVRKSLYLWQKSLFVSQILTGERLDMAHGIESRFPYLDNRVVAIAEKAPDAALINTRQGKRLLREALRGIVPEWIGHRPKRPFQAPPLSRSTHHEFAQYMLDVLTSQALRDSNLLDPGAVGRLLEIWPTLPAAAQDRLDPVIMMLLSLCALQKRYRLSLA